MILETYKTDIQTGQYRYNLATRCERVVIRIHLPDWDCRLSYLSKMCITW